MDLNLLSTIARIVKEYMLHNILRPELKRWIEELEGDFEEENMSHKTLVWLGIFWALKHPDFTPLALRVYDDYKGKQPKWEELPYPSNILGRYPKGSSSGRDTDASLKQKPFSKIESVQSTGKFYL